MKAPFLSFNSISGNPDPETRRPRTRELTIKTTPKTWPRSNLKQMSHQIKNAVALSDPGERTLNIAKLGTQQNLTKRSWRFCLFFDPHGRRDVTENLSESRLSPRMNRKDSQSKNGASADSLLVGLTWVEHRNILMTLIGYCLTWDIVPFLVGFPQKLDG